MYRELVNSEEVFIKKVVTDKYMNKYQQFKQRIQKHENRGLVEQRVQKAA